MSRQRLLRYERKERKATQIINDNLIYNTVYVLEETFSCFVFYPPSLRTQKKKKKVIAAKTQKGLMQNQQKKKSS